MFWTKEGVRVWVGNWEIMRNPWDDIENSVGKCKIPTQLMATTRQVYRTRYSQKVTHPRIGSVFKWLSKVITCLRLLFLAIGLKSRASFSTNEKTNTNGTLYVRFFRALSRLQLIADWFIALFAPVVIGRVNYLIIRFSTVIWKPI